MFTPRSVADSLGMDQAEFQRRCIAVGWTIKDTATLGTAWVTWRNDCESSIARLYERFRATPQLCDLLKHEQRVERLMALQFDYWKELFHESRDDAYILRRLAIGLVHHRIRVTPQWYMLSYSRTLSDFVQAVIAKHSGAPATAIEAIDSLQKAIFLDASLVIDSYNHSEEASLRQIPVTTHPKEKSGFDALIPNHHELHQRQVRPEVGNVRIRLDEEELIARKEFLGFDGSDLAILRSLRSSIANELPKIIDDMYELISSQPSLSALVEGDKLDRLKRQVSSYWLEFFDGTFDKTHAASRMRVGVIHESIGLEPQWYLIALSRTASALLRAIPPDASDLSRTLSAIFKALCFDISFVLDAYMEARAASLLHSEGIAHHLLAGLASAITVINPQDRIQYANEAFVTITGIAPGLLYLMPLGDALRLPVLLDAIHRMRSDKTRQIQVIGRWGQRTFRIRASLLASDSIGRGHPVAVVMDDVSEIMRLSDDIEQNAAQYKHLTHSVSAVLWEMDRQTRTIISISAPTLDMIGFRDIAFLGRPNAWGNCIAADDRKKFFTACESIGPGESNSCEYRMVRADGQEIWVRSILSRGVAHATSEVISAVTIDISEHRRAEKMRLAALENVANGVSRAVMNTLAAIAANLELFLLNFQDERRGTLDYSHTLARNALDILAKLRTFGGNRFLNSRNTNLNAFLNETTPKLAMAAGGVSRLRLDLSPNLPPVLVDADLLLASLGNLCENSAQAMPSGGEVVISTRVLNPDEPSNDKSEPNEQWIEVCVSDTGVGMSETTLKQAIEPFFTSFPEQGRIGLGLSMVHGFISQSNGRLRITSQQGVGTTVSLQLPSVIANDEIQQKITTGSTPMALIIGASEPLTRAIELHAVQEGFRYVTVTTFQDALAVIAKQSPQLVFWDADLSTSFSSQSFKIQEGLRHGDAEIDVVVLAPTIATAQLGDLPEGWRVLDKPVTNDALRTVFSSVKPAIALEAERHSVLSAREREVLRLIALGNSQSAVAIELGISERTVEQHVRNAKRKLNALNTIHAVTEAINLGEICT